MTKIDFHRKYVTASEIREVYEKIYTYTHVTTISWYKRVGTTGATTKYECGGGVH